MEFAGQVLGALKRTRRAGWVQSRISSTGGGSDHWPGVALLAVLARSERGCIDGGLDAGKLTEVAVIA